MQVISNKSSIFDGIFIYCTETVIYKLLNYIEFIQINESYHQFAELSYTEMLNKLGEYNNKKFLKSTKIYYTYKTL